MFDARAAHGLYQWGVSTGCRGGDVSGEVIPSRPSVRLTLFFNAARSRLLEASIGIDFNKAGNLASSFESEAEAKMFHVKHFRLSFAFHHD
jgi:hypothetical protein